MGDSAVPALGKNKVAVKTHEFGNKKFLAKGKTQNANPALKKPNQKGSCVTEQKKAANKISFSTASKSSSSISATKSKIPLNKKSTLDSTKTLADHRPSAKEINARKSVPQNHGPVKKETERKPTPFASFVKPNSAAVSGQRTWKTQSARLRSQSEAPNLCPKKRSASNVSARSTPCSAGIELTSAAGDCSEPGNVQEDGKQEQNELLNPVQTVGFGDNDDLQCPLEAEVEPPQIDINDPDKIQSCDPEQLKEVSKSNNILTLVDAENSASELKKELEETNKSLQQMEAKQNDLRQKQEADSLQLEKDLREKSSIEIAKKDEDIKEFERKSKVLDKQLNNFKTIVQNLEKDKKCIEKERDGLREELKSCRDCLLRTNKKLQDIEQELKQEKKNVKSKTEIIQKMEYEVKKLDQDLAEMAAKSEVRQTEISKKAQTECDELLKRISELSNQVNGLEAASQDLKRHNEKLEQKVLEMANIKEKLLESENKLRDLQAECDRKETVLAKVPDYSKEVQKEFAKLRQTEAEKQREIEKLKMDLSKTQVSICHLEQQVQRDQQLLDVRSGLINSLQKNEKTHRIHVDDLFAQVAEKNNTINELNCELQMKSEEFRNLVASLNVKQMEMTNQEHIVKLLEESNERSQMLRVKQEEKIGRLEEELANLKQTIAFYQAKVLATSSDSSMLCAPPTNVNFNENFYYYVSQRKKKRHIDINVKKYET